ncbi:MAG: hypothetical protein AABY27_06025 [Pseudomonadota bacterium]
MNNIDSFLLKTNNSTLVRNAESFDIIGDEYIKLGFDIKGIEHKLVALQIKEYLFEKEKKICDICSNSALVKDIYKLITIKLNELNFLQYNNSQQNQKEIMEQLSIIADFFGRLQHYERSIEYREGFVKIRENFYPKNCRDYSIAVNDIINSKYMIFKKTHKPYEYDQFLSNDLYKLYPDFSSKSLDEEKCSNLCDMRYNKCEGSANTIIGTSSSELLGEEAIAY